MARLLRTQIPQSRVRRPIAIRIPSVERRQQTISVNYAVAVSSRLTRTRRMPLQGWEGNGGEADTQTVVLDTFGRTENPLASGWLGPIWNANGQMQDNGSAAQGTVAGDFSQSYRATLYGNGQECYADYSPGNAGAFLYLRVVNPGNATTMACISCQFLVGTPGTVDMHEFGLGDGSYDQVLWSTAPSNGKNLSDATAMRLRVSGSPDQPIVQAFAKFAGGWEEVASFDYKANAISTQTLLRSGGFIGLGIYDNDPTRTMDNFGGGNVTVTPYPLTRRNLGPKPPMIVVQPNAVLDSTIATAVMARRMTDVRRKPYSKLYGPKVLAQPPPIRVKLAAIARIERNRRGRVCHLGAPVVVTPAPFSAPPITVHVVRTRPQKPRSVPPWPVVVFAPPLAPPLATKLVQARPRRTHSLLRNYVLGAATPLAPPLSVNCLQPDRLARRYHRQPPPVALNPPIVLQVFAAGKPKLARIRPRRTIRKLAPPTVIRTPSVEQREQTIATTLVRSRPRRTARFLRPPTTLSVFAGAKVTLAHTRPRPTTRKLALPTVTVPLPILYPIRVQIVRARPRPTTKFIGEPTTLTVFSTWKPWLVRTRPRRRLVQLASPVSIFSATIFPGPTVTLVRSHRGRGFVRLAPPTVTTSTQVFTGPLVAPVRTRPRRTTSFIKPPTVVQQAAATYPIRVSLARTRVRPTAHFLRAPTTLQTFSGPRVYLTRIRPRKTIQKLSRPTVVRVPSVEAREQQISVSLIRIRPRATRRFLRPPTVLSVFNAGRPALARTRPRPTTYGLFPPTVVRVPSVEQREDTITVHLARIRPRPTTRFLNEPTTLSIFAGPQVTLARIRPFPTAKELFPPTVVSVPSVEQREETITTWLVRTRPRPTTRFIAPPTELQIFSGPQVTLARIKPRPTTHFVAPPTVVLVPSVEQAQDTIRTTLARIRPRPKVYALGAPKTLQVFFGPRVSLTRVRPRPTRHFIAPPTKVNPLPTQGQQTIKVALVHTRPRKTISKLRPPTTLTAPTPPNQRQATITVALVHTRPRPTRRFLRAPTVVIPRATLSMQTIRVALVRTRPRHTIAKLSPPTVLATFRAARTPLVRTRPRPTIWKLSPPRVVRVPSVEQVEQTIRVTLARTRPRPTSKHIFGPTVLQTFRGPIVSLARIRPPKTNSILRPPATLRVAKAETAIQTALVTTRPRATTNKLSPPTVVVEPVPVAIQFILTALASNDRYRLHRRTIHTLPTVTYPVTFGPCFIASGYDRPAYLSSDYSVPDQAEGRDRNLGATSGRIVAEGGADGDSAPDGAAGGDVC